MNKNKIEEDKKGTFKGRRRVRRNKKYKKIESGEKIAGREFSPCSGNPVCSVCKASKKSWKERKR